MVNSASALLDGRRKGAALSDLLTGTTTAVDLVRALVDVTTADVAGLLPESVGELTDPPPRPLFAGPWARPWAERNEMLAPDIGPMTPVTDTAEKSDIMVGAFTVGQNRLSPHTAAFAADFSAALLARAQPRFRDTLAALTFVACQKALEPLLVADLSASATGAVDVLDAIAEAQVGYGGATVVLATAGALPSVWQAVGPLNGAAGAVSVVPVVGGTFDGAVVASVDNLHVEVGPLVSLAQDDPAKVGYNLGYYLAAVAWLADPSSAFAVPVGP